MIDHNEKRSDLHAFCRTRRTPQVKGPPVRQSMDDGNLGYDWCERFVRPTVTIKSQLLYQLRYAPGAWRRPAHERRRAAKHGQAVQQAAQRRRRRKRKPPGEPGGFGAAIVGEERSLPPCG